MYFLFLLQSTLNLFYNRKTIFPFLSFFLLCSFFFFYNFFYLLSQTEICQTSVYFLFISFIYIYIYIVAFYEYIFTYLYKFVRDLSLLNPAFVSFARIISKSALYRLLFIFPFYSSKSI